MLIVKKIKIYLKHCSQIAARSAKYIEIRVRRISCILENCVPLLKNIRTYHSAYSLTVHGYGDCHIGYTFSFLFLFF